jgi:hypothetical protein
LLSLKVLKMGIYSYLADKVGEKEEASKVKEDANKLY